MTAFGSSSTVSPKTCFVEDLNWREPFVAANGLPNALEKVLGSSQLPKCVAVPNSFDENVGLKKKQIRLVTAYAFFLLKKKTHKAATTLILTHNNARETHSNSTGNPS